MIDLNQYGSATPFYWTKEHLVHYMTRGQDPIISDPLILNAFRLIDRAHFVPDKYLYKAYQDNYIPIQYKEHLPSPVFVAKQMRSLTPHFGGSYLHLGTGTGYTASILAEIAGSKGAVYSLDRIQWMWENARSRIREHYPEITNLKMLFRDGNDGLPDRSPYNGILYSFIPDRIDPELVEQLAQGGKIVLPTSEHSLKVIEKTESGSLIEEILPNIDTSLFNKGLSGLS